MGFEDGIRRKHEFEASARSYFAFLAALSREELELALGRLMDRVGESDGTEEDRARARLLRAYLTLRAAGRVKRSKWERFKYWREAAAFCQEAAESAYKQALAEYEGKVREYEEERAAWSESRRKLPWLKRVLGPDPPAPPPRPSLESFRAELSGSGKGRSEFFLARASGFTLNGDYSAGLDPGAILLGSPGRSP